MGRRKGRKSGKSRRKAKNSKISNDQEREPTIKTGQSKRIISNAHGFPNLSQFSAGTPPYIPPQTMQRLVSDKISDEQRKLRNLDEQLSIYSSQLNQIRDKHTSKLNQLHEVQQQIREAQLKEFKNKLERQKEKAKFNEDMRGVRLAQDLYLEKLQNNHEYNMAVMNANTKMAMKKNYYDTKQNIAQSNLAMESTLEALKNTHQIFNTQNQNAHKYRTKAAQLYTKTEIENNNRQTIRNLNDLKNVRELLRVREDNRNKIETTKNNLATESALQQAKNQNEEALQSLNNDHRQQQAEREAEHKETMTIIQNTQEETMKEKENESKRKIQSIENQHQQDMQAMEIQQKEFQTTTKLNTDAQINQLQRQAEINQEVYVAQTRIANANVSATAAVQKAQIESAAQQTIAATKGKAELTLEILRSAGNIRNYINDANLTQTRELYNLKDKIEKLKSNTQNPNDVEFLDGSLDEIDDAINHINKNNPNGINFTPTLGARDGSQQEYFEQSNQILQNELPSVGTYTMPMPNFNTQIPTGYIGGSNFNSQNLIAEAQARNYRVYNNLPNIIENDIKEEFIDRWNDPNTNEQELNTWAARERNTRMLNKLNQAANEFRQHRITPADMYDLIAQYSDAFNSDSRYWTDEHQRIYAPIFNLGKQLEQDYNLTNPIDDDYQYNNF